MADLVFNIAKGRINELTRRIVNNDPANAAFVVIALQAVDADAVMEDFDDVAALLAGGSTEATFTGYARKVLDQTVVSLPTVDDAADTQWSDIADQIFSAAGGALNNNLTDIVIGFTYDSTVTDDSLITPLVMLDFSTITNGNDLTAVMAATGFFVAG